MPTLFAVGEPPGEAIAAFILISGALLVIGFLLWSRGKLEMNLILLGLVVTIAAIGYGGLMAPAVIPTVAVLAPTLMKLGVLMVLGGIAIGLLDKLPSSPPPDNRNTQG
jgi:hypothetical protein